MVRVTRLAPDPAPTLMTSVPPRPVDSAFGSTDRVDARTWDRWAGSLPPTVLDGTRVVVVAPHPDDETFGCGGLIAELATHSIALTVVTVTDGAASHPAHRDLAERRRAEQRRAVRELGSEPPVWLGLPDGGLDGHEPVLRSRLHELLAGSDLVVAPWPGDGHPDHELVGRLAAEVARERQVRTLLYPVWTWRWGSPRDLAHLTCTRLSLSRPAVRAKRAAIACYPTQTTAMLGEVIVDRAMVRRFSRPFEVYVDA